MWTNINADTTGGVVIVLAGGYTLALVQYAELIANLRNLYASYNAAKVCWRRIRPQRPADILLPPAVQRMKQYRDAIQSRFTPTDSLYLSLPALNPSAGSTPAPVQNIAWEWDKEQGKAKITFTASPSTDVVRYVLRYAPGAVYRVKNETTIATMNAETVPLLFATHVGLTNPNTSALFRVYAVTNTGHEKGSPTITVIHGEMLQTQSDAPLTLAKAA